jgi:hypothetical protein
LDLKTPLSSELLERAFEPFLQVCSRLSPETVPLYRRFLAEIYPPWRPYVHESRRDSVENYLDQLQASLT